MAIRILQEDEYGNRAVELSSSVGDAYCSSAAQYQQTVAVFESDGTVGLYKMGSYGETERLVLSDEEVEHLVTAYQAYKRDQETRRRENLHSYTTFAIESPSLDDHPF